jgi:hypothetical protein
LLILILSANAGWFSDLESDTTENAKALIQITNNFLQPANSAQGGDNLNYNVFMFALQSCFSSSLSTVGDFTTYGRWPSSWASQNLISIVRSSQKILNQCIAEEDIPIWMEVVLKIPLQDWTTPEVGCTVYSAISLVFVMILLQILSTLTRPKAQSCKMK